MIDESGFMIRPLVRRTWAPKGETPTLEVPLKKAHDRLSVISALTVSPQNNRLNLHFQLRRGNFNGEKVHQFLTQLLQTLRKKIILVLDRWSAHKKAVRLLQADHEDRVDVEWLPPYAPELNPVEGVWSNVKYAHLPNYVPKSLDQLEEKVERTIKGKKRRQLLLHSFFEHARLEL